MKERLAAALACLALASGCGGSDVDLDDPDQLSSYQDGFIWLSDEEVQECNDDTVADWKHLFDTVPYELHEDAFLLGCNDYLDGKMPRE